MPNLGPRIARPVRVRGKHLELRNVVEADAPFILGLRLDAQKNRYLSPVDPDLEKQKEWIRRYQDSTGQAYFIICDPSGEALGTVRLYDAKGQSFSWGSWILRDGSPASTAVESAVMVYALATRHWGFTAAHFQVHRENARVVAFHEKFGAVRVREDSDEIDLSIDAPHIEAALARYARYLPAELGVE